MASGSLSGPSTMRATSRMITSSPPVTLNTARSLRRGWAARMAPGGTGRGRYVALMQQRLPSLLDPPIAFAHRGASAHAPANTLEAFRLGLRLGATGLESDVWLTADGVPVLDHDGVVRHGVRRRPIATYQRAALPSHIPALADLYADCGTAFQLSLDIKDADAALPTVAVARAAGGGALERMWMCHPDHERLARW